MPNNANQAVGGMTESEYQQVRYLRGLVQQEFTEENVSIKDAVMWAVNNEVDRLDN